MSFKYWSSDFVFAGILKAKQKCLEIVHGLEVRDIKSFVSWMKTFQVEQGAAGKTFKMLRLQIQGLVVVARSVMCRFASRSLEID